MALLTMEGFEDGLHASRYYQASGTVSTSYGYNGGNGMRVGDSSNGSMWMAPDTADTTLTIGMNIRVVTCAATLAWAYIFSYGGSTIYEDRYCVSVRLDTVNERFAVVDRTGTTYTANGTAVLGVWYYLELQVVFDQTVGSWDLHVDGVSLASESNRDTLYDSAPVPVVLIFGSFSTDWADETNIDNIYFLDSTGTENTTFLGISEVGLLLPSGNGTTSNMTGSDGNQVDNYALVDENPASTADYVESDTQGDLDTYAMDDLSGTPTVRAVMTTLYAQKGAGSAKYVRPVVRSNGVDYPGTSSSLALATYLPIDEVWDVDPDTSATWAYTAVNAMEVGPEVRDS